MRPSLLRQKQKIKIIRTDGSTAWVAPVEAAAMAAAGMATAAAADNAVRAALASATDERAVERAIEQNRGGTVWWNGSRGRRATFKPGVVVS